MSDSNQPNESRLIITHTTMHLVTKKLLRVLSTMQARPPPRYARAMPALCPRYARAMPALCPRYARAMPAPRVYMPAPRVYMPAPRAGKLNPAPRAPRR